MKDRMMTHSKDLMISAAAGLMSALFLAATTSFALIA